MGYISNHCDSIDRLISKQIHWFQLKLSLTCMGHTWAELIEDPDVEEAHAMVLNCTITFLSIHIAKTDFSETVRPRGSSSVTNNWQLFMHCTTVDATFGIKHDQFTNHTAWGKCRLEKISKTWHPNLWPML